jgi:diguanylate cyclase (GGDEF)-like protein
MDKRAPRGHEICAPIAERLEELTGRQCFVRVQAGDGGWDVVVGADRWNPVVVEGALRIPLDAGPEFQAELVIARESGGGPDPLASPVWRGLIGDVAQSAIQLAVASRTLELALAREQVRDSFTRALLACPNGPALHTLIVETMARAVGAEIGVIALPLPGERTLGVAATYGYPAVVVEDVRQAPGEGILGRVFATGHAIVVKDVSEVPEHAQRRRYRSRSYLALPLTGAGAVQAVVALTDKVDGRPFDERDLAVLTSLGVPASLAIAREDLRERTRDLAHQASIDGLTGLLNRRYFDARLEQEIQRQRRQFDGLALLMVDLDNFKELNDSQGHLVGDRMLREVADILRRAVRIFDVCARYGGEEFVILMPGANAATALRIAERIRRQVEQHFASGIRSGAGGSQTVSVGVSSASASTTWETLISQADSALFRAKGTGKNVVCVYP